MKLAVTGLAFAFAASLMAAARAPQPTPRSPADSAAAFASDKGKFRILQDGAEVGTEEFELAPAGNAWLARGDATLRVPGSSEARSSGQLRVAADGTPIHYDWTAQTDKKAAGSVDFENGTAKTSVNVGKDPVKEDFKFTSPRVVILDNNLYDQYAILGRLYDWSAKGSQTFPVLIPQDRTPGSISLEADGQKSVGNAQFDSLLVRSADLEVDLFFDAKHRLMRLEVPAAKVVIVRQ